MGVAALVLGIVSVVLSLFGLGIFAVIIGLIGIVLGAIACKKEKKGINTAGLVLSIIGTALSLVFWLACAACIAGTGALL